VEVVNAMSAQSLGFDNIGLAVTDLPAALDFYERLGFSVESPGEGSASVRQGDALLYVFSTLSRDFQPSRRLDMDGNAPGIDHISFQVADVDEMARGLIERGVELESGPVNQDWGRRTITVRDPDGNRFWFLGPLAG
jgi:catechol 2,3-dioxygenase-like lactoylglutathione lyase family enzyme